MSSDLINRIVQRNANAMTAVEDRASDFASPLEMQLTAIGVNPLARAFAEKIMDDHWSSRRNETLDYLVRNPGEIREVIIGSGYHAAVYAATRVKAGFPKPFVIEASDRVGGTFAMTQNPTFFLNSRNRPGSIGIAGDRKGSLNNIPGATLQPANLSMSTYQTNADMAFAIRLALAEFAEVVPSTAVVSVDYSSDVDYYLINTAAGTFVANRIIDARGIGAPNYDSVPASNILNFPDFMVRMAGRWPLRGVRRAAVVGGGDSANCVVESLLGVGPQGSATTVAALDMVERIDWYAENLPTTCEAWRQQKRGRYLGIGQSLRPDRFGERTTTVINERVTPVALPGTPMINGRSYDLVVMATGTKAVEIPGIEGSNFVFYRPQGTSAPIAREYGEVYRVGPHARIPFSDAEYQNGVADIGNNAVAMFRTGAKTATLAATLPAVS